MKKRMLFASVLMVGVMAHAQDKSQDRMESRTQERRFNEGPRDEYIAKGMTLGYVYDRLDAEVKVKYKIKAIGLSVSDSSKTDRPIDASGLRIFVASMPKNGIGANAGASIQRINDQSKDSKTLDFYRAEGNVTASTPIGRSAALYGFGGAQLAHLPAWSGSPVETFGFGLQLGGGFAFNSNLSLELGYSAVRFGIKDDALKDTSDIEYDKTESYVVLSGLTTRLTYSF